MLGFYSENFKIKFWNRNFIIKEYNWYIKIETTDYIDF